MKVADFFCGAGGFSEGFRMAGFEVVFGVDKWGPAIKTHEMNHPSAKTINRDVAELSKLPDDKFHELIPDTEVIIGSPPCVAFSNSNKSGKADKSLGITLVESFLRIVARKKFKEGSILKYWILENVPNIQYYIKDSYTASDLGLDGDFILRVIHTSSREYNAKYYGVAQNRKRFFCGDFPQPEKVIENDSNVIPLNKILNNLGNPISKKNLKTKIIDPNYSSINIERNLLTDHFYVKEIAEFEWKKAKRAKTDKGYMGKMAFPENKDKPSRTIMATLSSSARESIIYDIEGTSNRFRSPTIREVASIMSFPIDYQFYGDSVLTKYRLVGNAVPPKLSFAFAKKILEIEGCHISNELEVVESRLKQDDSFTNLNYISMPINVEKPKNIKKARFKYHIPYLLVNAYRVELTNYNSLFEETKFSWDVEIHKGQGQSKKLYNPAFIKKSLFSPPIQNEIDLFLKKYFPIIPTTFELQCNYCLTEKDRKANKILGPFELLVLVKDFLEGLNKENELQNKTLNLNYVDNNENKLIEIPLVVGIGAYTLNALINKAELEGNLKSEKINCFNLN
ncbi:DNA cytosine methyltransferase [Mesobacillus jeotgali]|uniref:DNA cytosine methyltransferase n=1 Tax=Mesobacillus jeotgali TaxID=129985 RepID=UPI000C8460AD|nr:DNA cytosine methyltransferase [Mesobacillus jeotgali]